MTFRIRFHNICFTIQTNININSKSLTINISYSSNQFTRRIPINYRNIRSNNNSISLNHNNISSCTSRIIVFISFIGNSSNITSRSQINSRNANSTIRIRPHSISFTIQTNININSKSLTININYISNQFTGSILIYYRNIRSDNDCILLNFNRIVYNI